MKPRFDSIAFPRPLPKPGDRCLRLLTTLILGVCTISGCDAADESESPGLPGEWSITRIDTVVSLSSELLASPGDLSVADAGDLYIADEQDSRILRIPAGGEAPIPIGAPGEGPGEFDAPVALAVADDTLRVVEQRNGRVQVLDSEGTYQRSYPLPAGSLGGYDVAGDGRVAAATMGFRADALVLLYDRDGGAIDSLAEPVVPPHSFWDVRAIQNQIAAGEVPSSLRNWARPVLGPRGGTWVVLVAEGSVRRFDAAGELLWSRTLEAPELASIEEYFFERNAELEGQAGFIPLSYVDDGHVVGERLWLLLNTLPDAPCVVLVLDGEGALRQRLVLPTVQGARRIAVDRMRRRLYLALPSEATVLAADLPGAAVEPEGSS